MKVVVTGGAGFVGSNLVKKLNQKGISDIIIIDDYVNEKKLANLSGLSFSNYIDYGAGIESVKHFLSNEKTVNIFFHIGANSNVLESDTKKMMYENFEYSKFYLEYCLSHKIPFLYASTSAIYGNSKHFTVDPANEKPQNLYAWSKWLFDKYVLANQSNHSSKVIGLRLFNVFGLGEYHKNENACVANRFVQFVIEQKNIDLFDEQIERDYVWVEDLAEIFYETYLNNTLSNGIYNVGSSIPISHNAIAEMVVEGFIKEGLLYGKPSDYIKKIPIPDELKNKFQYYTCAEDLLPFISEKTINNKEKMKAYIKDLISRHQ